MEDAGWGMADGGWQIPGYSPTGQSYCRGAVVRSSIRNGAT